MESEGENAYFIVTEKQTKQRLGPGSLYYIKERTLKSFKKNKELLPMRRVGYFNESDVSRHNVVRLNTKEAELLQAVPDDSKRLKWFREMSALKTGTGLTKNTQVFVDEHREGEELRGIIRYIGPATEYNDYADPLSGGTFFGIELQGKDKGKGTTFQSIPSFTCGRRDGLLLFPFYKVRPVVPTSLTSSVPQASPQAEASWLSTGDRVTFYLDEERQGRGMVTGLEITEGDQLVGISTDSGRDVTVPLNFVCMKENAEAAYLDVGIAPMETQTDDPPPGLSLNSLVEVTLGGGCAYGVIRWIGVVPDRRDTMCGLELEDSLGVSDGTFKGQRYFHCALRKALFVKLLSCRPDSRFSNSSASQMENVTNQEVEEDKAAGNGCVTENIDPISTEQVIHMLIGRMRGIQGHCNSCYMDAALFSLFSCSSVLDSLLFKTTAPQDAVIQNILRCYIVNPLRSQGFVDGKHVMKLRQQLQDHGYSRSFTTDEKDPEEFLTVIMQHILNLEPLLKLSAGPKGPVQESYCYQIFLEQNHSLVLPTVQQLLEHSFHTAGLKLDQAPSCLILQMPRFGKKFKMFDKIIPSLELDITDLLSEGPQQCMLCGHLAHVECAKCFKEPVFSQTGFKLFCKTCWSQVHSHPQRHDHIPSPLRVPEGFQESSSLGLLARDKLELFAVLCIETSHYVSFVKHGPGRRDWIFFDSMADREGESNGYNIPEVLPCPEVAEYLDLPPVELANQAPREMKGVAKRLFCDAYMCLYQNRNMCLYR